MNRFEPSRANGEALRLAMDGALWTSAADLVGGPRPGLAAVRRATPLDYGAYSDLALNIPEWQDFSDEERDEAEAHLVQGLRDTGGLDGGSTLTRPEIKNFTEEVYSRIQLRRLKRWFATEEAAGLGLAPASEADLARVRMDLSRALDFMEKADPELFGEIVAIVDDIVVVCPDRSQRIDFTAGSTFAIWGAIAVNANLLLDWTEFYNTLAHEEGHNLLFALARDEPLVLNSNDAIFASPVRDDPRPMDGIYHTAFVVAREARALDRLLAWHDRTGQLSLTDRDLVAESLETSVITFWQSVDALDRDALLTELGMSILDECKDYMTRNFELILE